MTANKAMSNKDMNGLKVTNLGAPTAASNDAVRQVDLEANATADRSRANHTGTQLANTISNFDTQVRTSRLDQMAAPTAPVAMGSQKITGLADGTAATDGATKGQLDTAIAGLTSGQVLKGAVRVAATANVNLSAPGAAIDGVTLSNGDIFLATAQTTGSQNGPYVFNGSAAAATRATNWDSDAEAVLGSYWIVREGTKADNFALLTNDTAITVGTSTPAFTFFSASGGGGGRHAENSPAVSAGGTWTVTHNLNSQDVTVQVRRVASPFDFVDVYCTAATVNTVTISPDLAMASGEYRAIVKL
jgi:hypothetical protein